MTRPYDDEDTAPGIRLPDAPDGPADLLFFGLSGPMIGRSLRVPADGGVIGRDEDCAVHVADPGVSPRHAPQRLVGDARLHGRQAGDGERQ